MTQYSTNIPRNINSKRNIRILYLGSGQPSMLQWVTAFYNQEMQDCLLDWELRQRHLVAIILVIPEPKTRKHELPLVLLLPSCYRESFPPEGRGVLYLKDTCFAVLCIFAGELHSPWQSFYWPVDLRSMLVVANTWQLCPRRILGHILVKRWSIDCTLFD